ncbi:hypothetical protein J3B02_005562, partial [Coemansia erecta]
SSGGLLVPPPTRTISAVAMANERNEDVAKAQKMLVELAGLEVPANNREDVVADMLASELIDECLDVVPDYLLQYADNSLHDAESDIEDTEDGDVVVDQRSLVHKSSKSKRVSPATTDNNSSVVL